MTEREQRGLAIAATLQNRQERRRLAGPVPERERQVSSPSRRRGAAAPARISSCGSTTCKHIYAVEFTIEREVHGDGSETLTKTMTITEKVTYKQNWPAYNDAAVPREGPVSTSAERPLLRYAGTDPQRQTRTEAPCGQGCDLFAMAYKVYSTFSSRRFSTDLREAHRQGYMSACHRRPQGQCVPRKPRVHADPQVTHRPERPAPRDRRKRLRYRQQRVFGSNRFERWFDHKYGVTRQKCVWVKTHICLRRENERGHGRSDSGQGRGRLPAVRSAGQGNARRVSTIGEVSADKAYRQPGKFRGGRGLRRRGVHRVQDEHHGRIGRDVREDVPLLPVPAGRVHARTTTSGAMSNRPSRRSSGSSAMPSGQDRHGDGQRSRCARCCAITFAASSRSKRN